MRVRPRSRELLIGDVAAAVLGRAGEGRVRVAVDGAASLQPDDWAISLVDELRVLGRFALHVSVHDFLLPASQRFEFGRENAEAFYEGWRDESGLRREVLDPASPVGVGRVLPALWRTDVDRSARADYVDVPVGGVVVVSGEFLLGGGLGFEYVMHLTCSAEALARRTPPDVAWTLPAYQRYDEEVDPVSLADVAVRLEDTRRPAVVEADADP